jgi:Flp pilus assembly pilin Flp
LRGLIRWVRSTYARCHDAKGQGLLEYSLILALMVVILILVVMVLGNTVKNLYCNIAVAAQH